MPDRAKSDDKPKDQPKDQPKDEPGGVTTPSVGQGPTQDQAKESGGASDPQARRSRLASTEGEMAERAEVVASSHVQSVAPARAREEASAARRRAEASDPEQAQVEVAVADKLDEIAERYEAEQRVAANRSKIQNRGTVPSQLGGAATGPLGEPIPDGAKLGTVGVYHTPPNQPDTAAMVIGLWDEVDDDTGAKHRWRLNLVLFPLHGSPGSVEGVAYGSGRGQFQLVDDIDGEPDTTAPASVPFRHEVA